jgi:hypothetical protein
MDPEDARRSFACCLSLVEIDRNVEILRAQRFREIITHFTSLSLQMSMASYTTPLMYEPFASIGTVHRIHPLRTTSAVWGSASGRVGTPASQGGRVAALCLQFQAEQFQATQLQAPQPPLAPQKGVSFP